MLELLLPGNCPAIDNKSRDNMDCFCQCKHPFHGLAKLLSRYSCLFSGSTKSRHLWRSNDTSALWLCVTTNIGSIHWYNVGCTQSHSGTWWVRPSNPSPAILFHVGPFPDLESSVSTHRRPGSEAPGSRRGGRS
ncbi:unnamed protein product [Pelagomonas calceolata]|uniref:Uncharacterized protein n=1 Tax=Pelagomonas calceolata TaxID=35677 RepID=A0A8J2SRS2_9STRA|nr:unnamed protein product [Pelagomonas calceolata]